VTEDPVTVLFLCTGNSARSQIAEALLRHFSNGRIVVFSAGSAPQPEVHPLAKAILRTKYGLNTNDLRPKPISTFRGRRFDYVITLCDDAAESCPVFPAESKRIHWSLEDPAAVKDPVKQEKAFDNIATRIAAHLRSWLSLPEVQQRLDAK
jgi:ArsR family transcriptional regulator, arsenate/arsenite/antimonite-responsive transcriptional repressor / arsenate reductase (thioredoxin)